MKQQTERVKNFVDGFLEQQKKGYSISEIAEQFGISKRFAYQLLDQVSEKTGIPRDRLLQRNPYKERIDKGTSKGAYGVDVESLKANLSSIHDQAIDLSKKIYLALKNN